MGRQATPPAVLRDWSTTIQFRFAEALPLVTSWSCRDVAFHGGTSLNMSWGSPRYSEDLDFLLAQTNTTELEAVMSKALKRMQAAMLLSHPDVTLELKNKTREGGRLQHFQITASSSAYQEKCNRPARSPCPASLSALIRPENPADLESRSNSLLNASMNIEYAPTLLA